MQVIMVISDVLKLLYSYSVATDKPRMNQETHVTHTADSILPQF